MRKYWNRTQMTAAVAIGAGLILTSCSQTGAPADPAAKATPAAAPAPAPAATPPPAPVAEEVTIPSGTTIKIRTTTALSTKEALPGAGFEGSLSQALKVGDQVMAPAGAHVKGVVTDSDDGGRVKGVASISVRLTQVTISGKPTAVKTSKVTRAAPATKKKDAVKVGIGAGIGAAIGAIAGGGKGAAIGAASGGGAGTAVVLATHGDPAKIPSESLLTFKLTAPVTVAE
jgi:hypothetical protein